MVWGLVKRAALKWNADDCLTLGAALAWTFRSGLGLNIGMQRIIIAGGPTQLGAGLGWGRP